MKKILFIIDALSGGAGRVVYDIVKNLDSERFESLIVAIYPGGSVVEQFKDLDVKIINLNKGSGIGFKTISRLRKLMIKEKVDIVHTHNVDAYEYGVLAAFFAGVKKITHTGHGKSVKRGTLRRMRENLFHKFVSWFLDYYVVVSDNLGEYVSQNWCLNSLKVRTVYNGVDFERYKKRKVSRGFLKKYGVKDDDLLIGIIAGLRHVKNHKMLIKAIQTVKGKVPNAKLLIIGDGMLRKKLKKIVLNFDLEKEVLFLRNRDDVDKLLNVLDVNVLSSFSECLSMTLLEAMACEVPCVATDVGGNSELIDSNTGFLVPSRDYQAMASKIISLLKDSKLRKKLGKESRKKVIEEFSIKKMIDKYSELYSN